MKNSHIIVLVLLALALSYLALLKFVLTTSKTDVSHLAPYADLIGQQLKLKKDMLLVRNLDEFVLQNDYLLIETDTPIFEGITETYQINSGTLILINQAMLFTNKTSGITHSMLMGSINNGQGTIEFELAWGSQNLDLTLDNPNFLTFAEPVWVTDETYSTLTFYFDDR